MNQRPSLLFVSPRYLFPSDSGGKIRTRDVLRGMKGGAFDITLASPDSNVAEQYTDDIAGVCDRFVSWPEATVDWTGPIKRIASILSRDPISVATDRSDSATKVLASELERHHDLVVIDFPHADVLIPQNCTLPKVIFTHNVEAEILERHARMAKFPMNALWKGQAAKMRRYEKNVVGSCDTVVAVSERDGDFFRSEFGHPHVAEIPTGVDLDEFAYRPPAAEDDAGAAKTLIFLGSMNWRANIDAVTFLMDEVWPLVAKKAPNLKVVIVGHSPPDALIRKAHNLNIPWTFTGFVDDVRPYIYESMAFLMPIRIGGGTRIKTYQGMAMGCPVISTTIGVEGLPINADEHYLLADTAESFAQAILSLADNADRRGTLSRNAHQFVSENFSSTRVANVFEDICVETLQRTKASST